MLISKTINEQYILNDEVVYFFIFLECYVRNRNMNDYILEKIILSLKDHALRTRT